MNLRWNNELVRFEAEFHDFASDLVRVKEAGFKYDGPCKTWYSLKAGPLTKLKGTPNLTITPEARERYNKLAAIEKVNEEVKAQLAAHKKVERKQRVKEQHQAELHLLRDFYLDETMGCLFETPPEPKAFEWKFIKPEPPKERCLVCNCPVYPYEYAEGGPLACLWCQKIVLDFEEVV